MTATTEKKRIPIREKLLTSPLSPLSTVRLLGSRCRDCGEVGLGEAGSCQNCAGENIEVIPLSRNGFLWTYTVIRNKPPGDFKGTVPMGEGLVELPEGIRVKSPIGGDVEALEIGTELEFVAYELYENEAGDAVVAFRFDPVSGDGEV